MNVSIVADSVSKVGNRITTFVLRFPRIVLAELNTHRAFSRNSASSRAIPFNKMVKMVNEDPFIPIAWMKEHTGMQGNEYLTNESDIEKAKQQWLEARDSAVKQSKLLHDTGVTKQICNRLLEPFMWHTCILTATELENFFSLRAHPDAEIHIQKLAYIMLDEYKKSIPKVLDKGDWHLPFSDKLDKSLSYDDIMKVITARCARVSYLNFDGSSSVEADIKLHDRLKESGHWSPFEHCAQCMEDNLSYGNFIGWKQYRKHFIEENKKYQF